MNATCLPEDARVLEWTPYAELTPVVAAALPVGVQAGVASWPVLPAPQELVWASVPE